MRRGLAFPLLLLLFSSLVLSGSLHADAKHTKAREAWMGGYVKLEEAGKLEEQGDLALALSMYREALDIFHEVRRRFPAWNPSLLSYRISFCEERIRSLESRLNTERQSLDREELASVVKIQTSHVGELREENRALKEKVASMSESLERARREAARVVNSGNQLQELMKEREELTKRNELQQDTVRRLQKELAELKSDGGLQEASAKLKTELDQAEARKAELFKAYTTYRQAYDNVKERLKTAMAEVEQVKKASDILTGQNAEMSRKLEAAENEKADSQQQLAAMKQQMGDSTARIADKDALLKEMGAQIASLQEDIRTLNEFRDMAIARAEENKGLLQKLETLATEQAEAVKKSAALQEELKLAKDAATALEKQLAGAFGEIAVLKAEVGQQREEMLKQKKAHEDQIADFTEKLKAAEAGRQVAEKQAEDLPAKIDELRALNVALTKRLQVTEAKTKVDAEAAKAAQDEYTGELAKINRKHVDEIADKQREIDRFTREIAQQKLVVDDMKKRLREEEERRLQAEADAKTGKAQAEAALIDQTIASRQTEGKKLRTLQEKLADIVKQKQAAEAQAIALQIALREEQERWQETHEKLTAQAQTAEEQLAKQQEENTHLGDQLKARGNIVTALEKSNAEFREQVAGLTGETSKLSASLVSLRESKAEATRLLQEKNDALTAEKSQLTTKVSDALAENETLKAEREGLKEELLRSQAETVRIPELERRERELTKALEASEGLVKQQANVLAAQREKLTEMASLGELLKRRESELSELRQSAGELRKLYNQAATGNTELREELRKKEFVEKHLETQLENLRQSNQALAAAVDENREKRWREREQALQARVTEAEKVAGTLETENSRLVTRNKEQVALLQKQEEAITKLEDNLKNNTDEMAHKGEAMKRLEEQVAALKARTEVVDGLAASLNDADTLANSLRQEIQQLRNERDTARSQEQELAREVAEKKGKVAKLEEMIKAKPSSSDTGTRQLLQQLQDASIRLEKETQRRRALERALAGNNAAPPSAEEEPESVKAHVEGIQGESERERREREKRLLIRGYLKQGLTAEQQGNVEAACWNYKKVLSNDPKSKIASQRLGLIASEQGNTEEAVRYLHHAFRLDPDDLDTLLPLGVALIGQSEPDLAVSMLSRAVALEPDNIAAHRCLGVACSTLGWYDVAESQFRRAHKIDKNDPENAFNLAVLLATQKPEQMSEARKWYELARKLGAARDPGLDRFFGAEN